MLDVTVTILEFKNYLSSCGYAARTVESYRENLAPFVAYLKRCQIDDLRRVSGRIMEAYRYQVMASGLAAESKALRLRPVKRLFEYLVSAHKLLINPAEGLVETSRKNRKIGPVLTIEEVKKLLKQPNLSLRPHIRNRAVMEVLYATGMRINELVSLKVHHVDLEDKVIFIAKGKGKKQRVVPLSAPAAGFLREYLTQIRPWWAKKSPQQRALFLNHHGGVLTGDSVRCFLRRYRLAAGIKTPVSPHTFRRTCATHMLQQGADIRYIQKLLGHRHLKTTQAYTKVMPVEVKKTHSQTHPGSAL
ncbi:MAG: tyrosine-type recombinase/integrase [Desulfobacterales bacterium]